MSNILVGLSGGVDSSVAAALLLEQGHKVTGAYMKNWVNSDNIPGDCPWEKDIEDAHAVAKSLDIEFRVIDLVDQYSQNIVDYLLEGYRSGITPNPDVFCNREIKFGIFLDYAIEQGFEFVATGHYARKISNSDGSHSIFRGKDTNKDQSYFLALLEQHQIKHALFPCGEMLKPGVREAAEKYQLPTAHKKDSQGICFIGNIKMNDFLRHYIPDSPGNIIDQNQRVVGKHNGLHLYTLGQRKGHEVASPKEGVAYVVIGKNIASNELIVGFNEPDTSGLFCSTVEVTNLSWTEEPPLLCQRITAQPRYRAKSEPITIHEISSERMLIEFKSPQRAIATGQICAFYQQGKLLGGGIFQNPS